MCSKKNWHNIHMKTRGVKREGVCVRENEKAREIATFFPGYVLEVAKIFP